MEVKSRRRYSKEFREDVLNMLRTGDKNVPALSKELGIAEQVIYRWYKKDKGLNKKEEEKVGEQEKELRELRKKLAEVTEERDILKKAVHIFSRQEGSKQINS
jgi:transposase